MQLSKHFTLEELTISQTATRLRIDNAPDARIIANLTRTAAFLEQVRLLVNAPIRVSSGYRSPDLNRAIGGAPNSAHMDGLAADITVPGMTVDQLAQRIAESDLPYDQVINEFGQWVHVGINQAGAMPRRGRLLAQHQGGRTVYLPGVA